MAMGKRRRHAKHASMWVATQDLPRSAAHPFYARLNQILDQHDFDGFVEGLCERFYADDGRLADRASLTRRAENWPNATNFRTKLVVRAVRLTAKMPL
jgi:hypothetical protein